MHTTSPTDGCPAPVVESAQLTEGATTWRFRQNSEPPFARELFHLVAGATGGSISVADGAADIAWQMEGTAMAGRGNAYFLTVNGEPLVLRRYLRGGVAQRFSEDRYFWRGLSRTRAMCEFDLLLELESAGLPVMRAFAAEVLRHGKSYQASFISFRAPGRTLAEWLLAMQAGSDFDFDAAWSAIGRAIAAVHRYGIWHADLNAHNILVHDSAIESGESIDSADVIWKVTLIDFDRACRRGRAGDKSNIDSRWARQNLKRLSRSINKLTGSALTGGHPQGVGVPGAQTDPLLTLHAGWQSLLASYSLSCAE